MAAFDDIVNQEHSSALLGSNDRRRTEDEKDTGLFRKNVGDLTVNDAYEMAFSIFTDFDQITNKLGGEMFTDVVPKVTDVLEILVSFSKQSEKYQTELVELRATCQKLQLQLNVSQAKHSEELQTVIGDWNKETERLKESIRILKDNDEHMTSLLEEKLNASGDDAIVDKKDCTCAIELDETLLKQRNEIRQSARAIEERTRECEALACHANQLINLNENLRRKVDLLEKQSAAITSQRTDLKSTCNEKDRQIKELHNRIDELREKLKTSSQSSRAEKNPLDSCEVSSPICDPLLANKLIIDLNDPDRPLYTKAELQEILSERNSFKLKCILLKDELEHYKQFFKNQENDESWVNIPDESVSMVASVLEDNNNPPPKHDGVIKKLFASLFLRTAKSPELSRASGQPPIPHVLNYNPPLIDESDVMPSIDLRPSPEDEVPPPKSVVDSFGFENLYFAKDEKSWQKN